MANNTIQVTYKVNEDGSLEKISQKANKAAAATDNASRSSDNFSKKQKGVAGATSNSTKAFSKMSQGITSGLVPAYAALAANVFAVTAAFGVLQRAAGVKQLNEGLLFTGRAAGQNLPLIAQGLVEITGNAISAADAMKAVALGTSAGFNETQLKGLAEVAKGAAQALGRDVPDAIDRLTRGAAKLEPEILDELGIMVRIDDVTTEYAASLGKTASELSNFERRQAFANAIIEQGSTKFGALAKAVESNPYDKLAASFDNLVKTFVNGINTIVGPFAGFLAGNMMALIGAIGVFSVGVAKAMVPAIAEGGSAMAAASKNAAGLAKENLGMIKSFKGAPKVFDSLSKKVADGTATIKERNQLTTSLDRSIKAHNTTMKVAIATHGEESDVVKNKKAILAQVIAAREAVTAATTADTLALKLHTRSLVLDAAASGDVLGMLRLLKAAWLQELAATTAATTGTGLFTKALAFLRTGLSLTTFSLKAFGLTLLTVLPYIGLISMAIGALMELFKKDPVSSKWDDTLAKAKERYAEFPNIIQQMSDSYQTAETSAQRFAISIAVTTGLMQQLKTQMLDIINLEKVSERQNIVNAKIKQRNIEREIKLLEDQQDALPRRRSKAWFNNATGAMVNTIIDDAAPQRTQIAADLTAKRLELQAAVKELNAAEAEVGILDPNTYNGVQQALLQAQVGFEAIKTSVYSNTEEKTFAEQQLAGVNVLLKELETAQTPEAIQKIYEKFSELEVRATATKGSLDSAKEVVTEVEALFAKGAARTGMFSDSLKTLDTAVNALASNQDFQAIVDAYGPALEKFGIDPKDAKKAKEDLNALRDRYAKFNKEMKELGTEGAKAAGSAASQNAAGLSLKALITEKTFLDEKLRLAKEQEKLAITEDEKIAAKLATQQAINEQKAKELAISKQIIADATRLGGANVGAVTSVTQFASNNQEEFDAATTAEKIQMTATAMQPMIDQLKSLGPQGELVSAMVQGTFIVAESFARMGETITKVFDDIGMKNVDSFAKMEEAWDKMSDPQKLQVIGAALQTLASSVAALGNVMAAASRNAIAGIDQQIEAEKKRDGRSAQSVEKLKQLEAKKEKMKRKEFETNKKFQLANAIIATALGITQALAIPVIGVALAGMIAAMGAAQIAIISGMTYNGGTSSAPSAPSSISVGNRQNSVDMAKARSPSGELAYARGAAGTGTSMTNYTPAFTGMKYRASGGNTGLMVGEQGPELFIPDRPGRVVPADETARGGAPVNVNFTIQAIDTQNMEQALMAQRGAMIGMIREAANAHGENFLESINTEALSKER